jgi:uncharacterized protein (DUF736 family)
MNIGIFSKTEDGSLIGNLPPLGFRDVTFEAVAKKGNGPDYRITIEGAELGAAWKKTSEKGNDYLSAQIDCPVFTVPVNFAVFDKNGVHVAVWDRQKPE